MNEGWRPLYDFRKLIRKKASEGTLLKLFEKISNSGAYEFWNLDPYKWVLAIPASQLTKKDKEIIEGFLTCKEFVLAVLESTESASIVDFIDRLEHGPTLFIEAVKSGKNRAWMKIEYPRWLKLSSLTESEAKLINLYASARAIEKRFEKAHKLFNERYGTSDPSEYPHAFGQSESEKNMTKVTGDVSELARNVDSLARTYEFLEKKMKESMEKAAKTYGL